MPLEKAGVSLVAENYQTYMAQLSAINKAQKEAFSNENLKAFQDALKRVGDTYKNIPKAPPPVPKLPAPEDANRLQQALDYLGKTGKFAISEINAETLKLQAALREVSKAGKFEITKIEPIKSDLLGPLTANLDDALKKSNSLFAGMNKAIQPVIGNVGALASEIGGMLGKFTIIAAVIKGAHDLMAFGQASVAVAQRNETLRVSLEEVGQASGYTIDQIDLATKLLNKQGITTSAAQESLMRMARANISWAEASKLAAIAQGSAVVAGMNSSEAFNRLVTGIQKMEPELLDELGITLRRQDAYDRFAETVGKNSRQLSDAEKQQAILNEIYRQSETVIGVYDAAMETSGKQQASLARLIEETQNNLGKFLLPLQSASIEMQTNFWKGAQTASKALGGLQVGLELGIDAAGRAQTALANAALSLLTLGQVQFDEKKTFAYKMGEAIYNFSRFGLMNLGIFVAGAKAMLDQVIFNFSKTAVAVQKLAELDPQAAWAAMGQRPEDPIQAFQRHFDEFWQDVIKKNPELTKSWEELNAAVEGTPEDLRLPELPGPETVEDTTEAIKEQIDALEALADGYKSVQDIQEKTQEQQKQAWEDYQQGLVDAEEKYNKARAKKIADFQKEMAEFEADNARKRAKMIEDFEFNQIKREKEFAMQRAFTEQNYNLKVKQETQKFYEDQKKAQRQFQLSQLQAQRQFQVTDRRLRADGDVIALMEAREDFALQQQEAKENYQAQKTNAKDTFEQQRRDAEDNFKLQEEQARQSFAFQTEIQREEFQRRLAEFDENLALERQKRVEANELALQEMAAAYEEEKAQLLTNYEDKMKSILEQRDKELQALGDSMKEQGVVTEEGMREIADKVAEVFGDEAAADMLIKGWSERSKNTISSTVDEINAKIKELKAAMDSTGVTPSTSSSKYPGLSPGASAGFGSNPSTLSNLSPNNKKPIGMRHGGSGIVTGPATFQVEPGVREHVAFTPLNSLGNLRLSGRAGIDVTGMPAGTSPEVSEKLADTLVEELRQAVRRLSRRNGR